MSHPDDTLPEIGSRGGVPQLMADVDWGSLSLDATHGFILSRIDGATSLGEICLLAPFPEEETVRILVDLHRRGVIDIPGVVPAARTPTLPPVAPGPPRRRPSMPPSQPVPSPSHDAQRRPSAPAQPAASLDGLRRPSAPAPPAVSLDGARRPSAPGWPMAGPNGQRRPSTPAAEQLAATPEDETELDMDTCRRIVEMLGMIGQVTPEEFLGVTPDADGREVRRAYFRLSKEFHPDRYYGRRLGAYKQGLQQVFTALSDAFNALSAARRPQGGR